MDIFTTGLPPSLFAAAIGVTFLAGIVKGTVGFAMPMIMISGLSSIIAPELALAALILPTLATNAIQALRQGPRAAVASLRECKVFLAVGGVFLLLSAQLVNLVPSHVMLLMIGLIVCLFTGLQLAGVSLKLARSSARIEAAFGAVAGAIGGVSGIWGPPTVMYLNALDVAKTEAVRLQGVIYGLGAVVLMLSHIGSGVLNARSWPFSAVMLVPAIAGLLVGFRLHDKTDQESFRKLTQIVLFVAGLNLVRRGLMG